jgi:ABC-type microcin C transport system permease subunit YejB
VVFNFGLRLAIVINFFLNNGNHNRHSILIKFFISRAFATVCLINGSKRLLIRSKVIVSVPVCVFCRGLSFYFYTLPQTILPSAESVRCLFINNSYFNSEPGSGGFGFFAAISFLVFCSGGSHFRLFLHTGE